MGMNVRQSFRTKAERCFRFLVDDFGAAEPVYSANMVQSVVYEGREFIYEISYDERDCELGINVGRCSAAEDRIYVDLEDILVVLHLAKPYQVTWGAQSIKMMQRSMDSAASWIRQVHPYIVGPDGENLLIQAREILY